MQRPLLPQLAERWPKYCLTVWLSVCLSVSARRTPWYVRLDVNRSRCTMRLVILRLQTHEPGLENLGV